MRSTFLAATLILIATSAPSAEPVSTLREIGVSDAAACPDSPLLHSARRGQAARASNLADLPPANAYLAVLRVENGCQVPVMAGYGYGSPEGPSTTPPRR